VKAVLVCHQEPRPVGHGGHRRAYQVRRDLEEALGEDNVVVADNPWDHYPGRTWRTLPSQLRRSAARYLENPLRLVARTRFASGFYSLPDFHAYYERLLDSVSGPALAVLEHAAFSGLLPIHARRGMRTVACVQNLESFDMSDDLHGRWTLRAKVLDLANEIAVLARCDHRLFISRVEAGLLSGLGLSGAFYPYLPVGEIKARLEKVRDARARGRIEPGLLLLLGTVGPVIRRGSFGWFLDQARSGGLPDGVRLVVAGMYTETLLPPGERLPGVQVRGWLEEEALDDLLARAAGVLVPHQRGFGTLTRMPEMSCAGVPVFASRSASYAQDPPPGTTIVDDSWEAWRAAMESTTRDEALVPGRHYENWAAAQPRPLPGVLKAVAAAR
jgi:hypothetical protein